MTDRELGRIIRNRTCIDCEYFDIGGLKIKNEVKESGIPRSGDCMSPKGHRFKPMSNESLPCFVLDSTSGN